MIINPRVPLNRLILSLSRMLDYIHPNVIDHQLRVGYIAVRVAEQLGFDKDKLLNLVLAAALHDIGLVGVENRIRGLSRRDWESIPWHSQAGYFLLKGSSLFSRAADIVRYHHTCWDNGRGSERDGQQIPFSSHILVFADCLERTIDRDKNILDQRESIITAVRSQAVSQFHPDCVDAFLQMADNESFWLDCASERIYDILSERMDWPLLSIDEQNLESVSMIFASITDATSSWTATHSAGVMTAGVEIARRLKFSPKELTLMRSAGYFHDIGKLTVPTKILDNPGRLTPHQRNVLKSHTYYTFHILNTIGGMPQISEWAAFHHERLDGNGYPFHHSAENLTLGARIMAVADVFGALTEDRPYHKAMSRREVMKILGKLAGDSGLDGDIVDVLEKDYDVIYDECMKKRALYAERQEHLLSHLYPEKIPQV